jgi:hypothetical protein
MWEFIEKLITDITVCTVITVNSVTPVKPTIGNPATTNYKCKIIEVRNTSTTDNIRVYPNNSTEYFTMLPLERRIVMVKNLNDLSFSLATGTTSTRIELVIEN